MAQHKDLSPDEKLRRAERSASRYKTATFLLALTTICLPIISAVRWEKHVRKKVKQEATQEVKHGFMQIFKDNGDFDIETKTDTAYYGDSLLQNGEMLQPQYKTNTTIDSANSTVTIPLDKLNLIQ